MLPIHELPSCCGWINEPPLVGYSNVPRRLAKLTTDTAATTKLALTTLPAMLPYSFITTLMRQPSSRWSLDIHGSKQHSSDRRRQGHAWQLLILKQILMSVQ
nr:hypothetical protein Iba_chr10aCG13520 [Ipomoea batatas]